MNAPTINGARLYKSIRALGRIGAYRDERTGLAGVNRLALSAKDGEGRRLVVKWFKEAGLRVRVDRVGNVYAWRKGLEPELRPVVAGSHIDSVPTAGAFDGCLGVLGALEVARTLDEHKVAARRPFVVAFFTEEEGCRFGTDMLGSAVATGRVPLERAYALKDREGLGVKEELGKIGFLGSDPVRALLPHAYVECHIEQGPILKRSGMDLGVVSGVQAISWFEALISGKSAHAGTTPMDYRRDAGVAAAKLNLKLRDWTASELFGRDFRATMGVLQPHPGMVNVVPGRLVCSVDLRNPEDAKMRRAEEALFAYSREVEREEGVSIRWRRTAGTPAVRFDASMQALIDGTARDLGLRRRSILSGAGHDAQEWSRLCKTAMIFVPGEFDGISHNPREFSTPKQCADGARCLLRVVLSLLEEGGR